MLKPQKIRKIMGKPSEKPWEKPMGKQGKPSEKTMGKTHGFKTSEDVPFRSTRSSLMAKLSAWALSVISLSGKRDLASWPVAAGPWENVGKVWEMIGRYAKTMGKYKNIMGKP